MPPAFTLLWSNFQSLENLSLEFPSEREQQLFVRLFLRKHIWLRAEKISYKDIAADLGPVISGLVQQGFLVDGKCVHCA